MTTAGNSLLIADLRGRLNLRCEPGPAVHGQVWLRRHENFLVVYWEVWVTPFDDDGTPQRDFRHTDRGGILVVAESHGAQRWQTLCVVPGDQLPAGVADLAAAYASAPKRELLLSAALNAINGQIGIPLQRGRFELRAHRWRESVHDLRG
jgi:hypothetical protein